MESEYVDAESGEMITKWKKKTREERAWEDGPRERYQKQDKE